MSSSCSRCPVWNGCLLECGESACISYAKENSFDARPTNLDKITNMSDKQVAKLLCDADPTKNIEDCIVWLNSIAEECVDDE